MPPVIPAGFLDPVFKKGLPPGPLMLPGNGRGRQKMENGITYYEQCFHASSNGILITDQHGRIVDINKQAEEIHGLDGKGVMGKMVTDCLPITGKEVLNCLRSKQSKLGIHIHGQKVDHVLDISTIIKKSTIQGTVCTFQEMGQFEVSARKLESYKKLNRQLEAIFDSSSDGIWVLDKNGTVLSINHAAETVEGLKRDGVIGKQINQIVEKGFIDQAVTPKVLRTKKKVSIISYKEKTKKTLLVTGSPVFDEAGEIYLVIVNERDMTELTALKEKLERSNMVTEKIKDELSELALQGLRENEIISESKKMRNIVDVAAKLSRIDASNILILGESGTGKSLLAKFIHSTSRRKKKPIIEINCAAIPENLLEAELFGYEKGAFTGARQKGKAGLFELAHKGTLFLDEIGDMPLFLQAKLLKYLDDKTIMRLGGTQPIKVDCIVVAATNQNLDQKVKEKKFRKDLFYRLNSFIIHIPPLRERSEDIFPLMDHFLTQYNAKYGLARRSAPSAVAWLQSHSFPGNVRELKNLVQRAVVMSEGDVLEAATFQSLLGGMNTCSFTEQPTGDGAGLKTKMLAFEKSVLIDAMRKHTTTRAIATALKVDHSTIVRKLKRHGVSPAGAV